MKRSKSIQFSITLALLIATSTSFAQQYTDLERPPVLGTPTELGLAGYAKVLCSAVFVSGRDAEEAAYNSGYFLLPEDLQDKATYDIDREKKRVEMSLPNGLKRSATWHGDQGCIIDTDKGLAFAPVKVKSTLSPANSTKWPMGDADATPRKWKGYDKAKLQQAVDQAFAEEALTAAFVVVHKGKIIAEQYGNGADMHTQLESWSMGKSLTATLTGRMIEMGYFGLDDPAPVSEWQAKGDPRQNIRIQDLLQMSSGLHFTAHRDPEGESGNAYLDHFYVYTGAIDVFQFSINRPLQFPTGTEGRYRNCDPLTLGYIMRNKLGSDYWTYPQRELFDKIGIREQIMETDPFGNFLLTGYDYGTARNWARLGMLYLQDGMWEGERILPEGWSAFVSTHAPGWDEPVYGGLFWLNGNRDFPLPKEMYYMAGAGGQRTIIVPSMDLVIVRMGHFRGSAQSVDALNKACELIVNAIK